MRRTSGMLLIYMALLKNLGWRAVARVRTSKLGLWGCSPHCLPSFRPVLHLLAFLHAPVSTSASRQLGDFQPRLQRAEGWSSSAQNMHCRRPYAPARAVSFRVTVSLVDVVVVFCPGMSQAGWPERKTSSDDLRKRDNYPQGPA